MTIAVVYCYPLVKSRIYFPLAQRFAATWKQFPPGIDHRLVVVCNGNQPGPNDQRPFQGIACEFYPHNNIGWDIGAFQQAAEYVPCDLLVCLGAPVHFHKPNWLERMADAYVENGPNLYGCTGVGFPDWHVRTTAFWLHPELLRSYPYQIGNARQSRYDFEHGRHSITHHALDAGLEVIMVTSFGCFRPPEWAANAPTPREALLLDQHTHL